MNNILKNSDLDIGIGYDTEVPNFDKPCLILTKGKKAFTAATFENEEQAKAFFDVLCLFVGAEKKEVKDDRS